MVCEGRIVPSSLLCLADLELLAFKGTSGDFKKQATGHLCSKYGCPRAKNENTHLAATSIAFLCMQIFVVTFWLKRRNNENGKKTVEQEGQQRHPSIFAWWSGFLWTVTPWLWYPLVTAMNLPLLQTYYTAVTKLDEWHARQWM